MSLETSLSCVCVYVCVYVTFFFMSFSLDFKLRLPPPPNLKSLPPPLPVPVLLESVNLNLHLEYWTIAARIACVVAVLPLLLLPNGLIAVYAHLLTMPATAFVLQKYNHIRHALGPQSLLAIFCIFLANVSAVLMLIASHEKELLISREASIVLAGALILGASQLLWVSQKRFMLRVMFCTATALMVMALATLGAVTPASMSRYFFQSSAMPLVLLFMETSRADGCALNTAVTRL